MPTLRRVLVPLIAHLFVMWRGWWQGTAATSSRRGKTRLISAAVEDRQRRVAREAGVGRRALAESEDRSTSRLDGARVTTMAAQARRRSRIHPGAPVRERGGEGGIRTHEVLRLNAFQERRLQPLGHLSTRRIPGDPNRAPDRIASSALGVRARGPRWGPRCRVGSDAEIQTRVAGQLRGSMTSRPRYGRNTSGTVTVPSGRWYVSRIAATIRGRARPDPLRVWTSSGFAPASGR